MLSDYQNYVIEVSSGMFKKEKEKTKQRWKAMNACGKDEKKINSEREVYRLLLSPIMISLDRRKRRKNGLSRRNDSI